MSFNLCASPYSIKHIVFCHNSRIIAFVVQKTKENTACGSFDLLLEAEGTNLLTLTLQKGVEPDQ